MYLIVFFLANYGPLSSLENKNVLFIVQFKRIYIAGYLENFNIEFNLIFFVLNHKKTKETARRRVP